MKPNKIIFPLEDWKPSHRIFMGTVPTLIFIILQPLLPDLLNQAPVAVFFPLAILGTWLGGSFSGFISVTLSTLFIFLVIKPKFILQVSSNTPNFMRMIVFYSSTLLFLILVYFLQRALRVSQNAVRIRDEFLNSISHELRTPLTAMKLNFAMLKSELEDKNIGPFSALNALGRQLNKQERLVNSIMDLLLIETNDLGIRKEFCDLSSLVQKASEAARDSVNKNGLEFDLVQMDSFCDRNRMEQAIYNLVHNAMRFGSNEPVKVSLVKSENMAKIRVVNRGPRIIESHRDLIFKKFERPSNKAQVQGPGVGLYLTRYIVELHEGRVELESSTDEETIFTIALPV